MSDLYLIAHKVRGEPAFDVATRVECAECGGEGLSEGEGEPTGRAGDCTECDHLGYWWIIPTSGWRAYPYDSIVLSNATAMWLNEIGDMPPSLPDHYRPKAEPKRTIDITALVKAKPFKMNRRI